MDFLFHSIHTILLLFQLFANCFSLENSLENFRRFSKTFLEESSIPEILESQGATVFQPFGVGYTLANIHSSGAFWNVSTSGIDTLLRAIPTKTHLSSEYSENLGILGNRSKVKTNNILYVKSLSDLARLTEKKSQQETLETDFIFLDYLSEDRGKMNDLVSNHTDGKLDNKFVPRGTLLGDAFHPFTVGVYMNTMHYKGQWRQKWVSIGNKTFQDGATLPYMESTGNFPIRNHPNFKSVAVPLQDGKYFVLVLPGLNSNLTQFVLNDLPNLLENPEKQMNPESEDSWKLSEDTIKVQVPRMNFTTHGRHLEFLKRFANTTFCYLQERIKSSSDLGQGHYNPSFVSPIVQAHYLDLTENFLELASASGAAINSVSALNLTDTRYLTRPDDKKDSSRKFTNLETGISPFKNESKNGQEILEFTKPYFWYLYDKNLENALYFGGVFSIEKYLNEHFPPAGFEWLLEVHKMYYWNCPEVLA